MAENKVVLPSLSAMFVLPIALSTAYFGLDFIWKAQGIVPKGLLAADTWTTSLRCAGTTSLPILLFVVMTGMLRGMTKSINPIEDPEAPILKASRNALTNTIEQSFIFVLNILIASSSGLSQEHMWLLTAFFLGSRLVFFFGYLLSVSLKFPALRSFGFLGTLGTNLTLLAFNLSHIYHKYQVPKIVSLFTA
jgi:uncharacterized MAPEG superfamily protein